MTVFSFLRVLLHLLQGLATSAFVFPFANPARREVLVRNWSAALLRILRVQLDARFVDGAPSQRNALVVANHVSWLDIFVVNAVQPCHFVAKADIRNWPVLGWLCEKAGTIFIARGRQREVRRVQEGLVVGILRGQRIAFFPEGTTSAQGELLPFHSNLFEAAITAGVPVKPYALRYLDAQGALHPAANFVGETTFVDSLMMILKARGMRAQLIELPLIDGTGLQRRELAQHARLAIADALQTG
ncbi:1-acyl-sn-glycerol-3-phosphate acyltransferase [Oxalicibacterium flavum]|uniref:1-acyl-sn-glycerol-3-phosphate acyltransferase n=1 Tax=Oxalicibacterium flavum TaxID=179467 RepID=A0A8J2XV38_9BURK|nr:1-acyl-sn-glycerol-3-phosphate acyltransferase [Oxalicibacterium flavum]GGC08459.1 1-acyl-sn-glycerol-3-phosphate acyltransferase [Oxalicibacterium flavum]